MRGRRHIGRGVVGLAALAVVTAPTGAVARAFAGEPARDADPARAYRAPARPARVHPARAHSASTLNGTDTAHLRLIHQNETLLYEEGAASGELPGHMRAELTVGSVFSGRCTIYTAGGSVTGHGRATPHGSGRYQSFSGSLEITGGSGRYAHIHGRTGLYGTFDRRTFSLVIQTTGKLSY